MKRSAARSLMALLGLASLPGAWVPPALAAAAPEAIASDPAPDKANPPQLLPLAIPSHGQTLFGTFYRAGGAEAHPTAILLHGLPGFEQNGDLAQALRRAGWNALIFHYRGSWGSGGTFSLANSIEDLGAVLAYLRSPENAARLGVDPARLVLIGHGWGGFLAGYSALHDSNLLGIALISAWSPGILVKNPNAQRDQVPLDEVRDDPGPLANTTPDALFEEARQHAAAWNLTGHAAEWKSLPVLIVGADDLVREDDMAIAAALRKQLTAGLTEVHLATDHAYSGHRIALTAAVLGWLKQLEPSRVPRHAERARPTEGVFER